MGNSGRTAIFPYFLREFLFPPASSQHFSSHGRYTKHSQHVLLGQRSHYTENVYFQYYTFGGSRELLTCFSFTNPFLVIGNSLSVITFSLLRCRTAFNICCCPETQAENHRAFWSVTRNIGIVIIMGTGITLRERQKVAQTFCVLFLFILPLT